MCALPWVCIGVGAACRPVAAHLAHKKTTRGDCVLLGQLGASARSLAAQLGARCCCAPGREWRRLTWVLAQRPPPPSTRRRCAGGPAEQGDGAGQGRPAEDAGEASSELAASHVLEPCCARQRPTLLRDHARPIQAGGSWRRFPAAGGGGGGATGRGLPRRSPPQLLPSTGSTAAAAAAAGPPAAACAAAAAGCCDQKPCVPHYQPSTSCAMAPQEYAMQQMMQQMMKQMGAPPGAAGRCRQSRAFDFEADSILLAPSRDSTRVDVCVQHAFHDSIVHSAIQAFKRLFMHSSLTYRPLIS